MHGAYEGMESGYSGYDGTNGGTGGRLHAVPDVAIVRGSTLYERTIKPGFDRVFALLLIVVLSPAIAVVALLVRLQLGPGVIYRQYRIGQHGVPFTMYKFRTMEADRRRDGTGMARPDRRSATDRRQVEVDVSHRSRRRQERNRRQYEIGRRQTHKTLDDPRHTRLGRFLRASSLDELPQLLNALRGELSLVGPRPELPEVVANYRAGEHRRHEVKPGITGLYQVTERANDEPMHEYVATDLRYVDQISAGLDAKILFMTLPVLLGLGQGGR